MAQYRLKALLCASLTYGAFTQTCQATSMQLNIYVNQAARKSLIATNQQVVIVLPEPTSAGGTTVIAAKILQPIADLTALTLDTTNAIYISSWPMVPPAPLDIIKAGTQNSASNGYLYSFDGVQINGNGSGLSGHIGIYYNAPENAQAVVTGLAVSIYETGTTPSTPLPINYYTLNKFETQYIKQPTSIAWVFVASNVSSGTVLPLNILTPASASSIQSQTLLKSNSSLQIGRYLAVSLSPTNPASIHFDTSINAFADNTYPAPE